MSETKKDAPAVKESSTVPDSTKDNDTKSPEELKADQEKDKQVAADQKGRAEKAETDLKEANTTIDDLKAQLEAKADDKGDVSDENIKAIAEKHGVDPAFAQDLANAMESKATEAVKATEEKLTEEMDKAKTERNQEKLDKAFDAAFTTASEDYGDLAMDKDAVKDLYLSRKSKNEELTVADVLQTLYGAASGKTTTEDDARGDDHSVGETIDFAKASKDPDQLNKLMKDPKAKKDYLAWRDANDM